ncbi:cation:proton antiporter domain-containing protein [Actinoalloteichus hymeniacidonis]|uniref:cation:proton antiporter domain-containing protein n=1 Tax=Actinoalloteichus hymeniacidonis TaxID=340345 RepID=UPI000853C3DB|nr:cation:proton antiporter [Actinoalloteichus hymeniacidonis]MBB5909064.1 Kef-type K+ transport system membrane component KefB [Actinoalloteichus hymeniacidonis]
MIYFLFVVPAAAIALFLVQARTSWVGDEPAQAGMAGQLVAPLHDVLGLVLVACAIVVVATQLAGALAARFQQPRVVGEITAGLLLGPTVLGLLAPSVSELLFPGDVRFFLTTIGQLGVIFFMFEVGRELPFSLLKKNTSAAVIVGHAGIAIPFVLGVCLAVWPLADLRPEGVGSGPFAIFIGVALSVTAFPVLAKILHDRKIKDTRIGALGMATAGIDDVTAWCLLALVVAGVNGDSLGSVLGIVLLSVTYAAMMWWVVRPLLARLAAYTDADPSRSPILMIAILMLIMLSSGATAMIGIEAIFGAFLAGIVTPRSSRGATEFAFRLSGPTHWLMLPVFFAGIGLSTDLWDAASGAGGLVMGLVLLVAVGGKFLGVVLPALAVGTGARTALALGSMMNCRGLTEIVVLNLGLSLGVISADLFAAFLIMTLLTTAVTGPLLELLRPRSGPDVVMWQMEPEAVQEPVSSSTRS